MKKFLAVFAMGLMMAALTSCGGHANSPEGVALAAVECMANKDVKGYMDLTNATDEQKQAYTAMLNEKLSKQLDEMEGISKYEVAPNGVEIDEEKGTANVKVNITYGNGETKTEKMKMVNKDGKWMLSADK